jgi:prepilin-type processing-associated H-X9-DG protein
MKGSEWDANSFMPSCGKCNRKQRFAYSFRVTHALNHIQVVLIHKFRIRLRQFAFLANVDTAVLTPERMEMDTLEYAVVSTSPSFIFVFHGTFVIFSSASSISTPKHDGGFNFAFVDATLTTLRVELLKCRAVVWATGSCYVRLLNFLSTSGRSTRGADSTLCAQPCLCLRRKLQ